MTETPTTERQGLAATPAHRYTAQLAGDIEAKWQDRWEREKLFYSPNPGEPEFARFEGKPKRFILDMFPYPSGAGLHVGHPLGYIATDIYARYLRATGHNVLHAMGYDAYGLPAEQYAVQTGQHPRVTTEQNITRMREQLRRLGLDHDAHRSVATIDLAFVRWTQWIFLQIFGSWFDTDQNKARPISELESEFASGAREARHEDFNPDGKAWSDLDDVKRRRIVDSYRLAYLHEAPVNWCPALGTVLANEEVTADGRSERGNFPVYKRPLKQWMMRITSYAERLLRDLELVNWPEPVKLMQRNWIGRSEGAYINFPTAVDDIRVFTTRPDTVFGATYMVLAPEHPFVDELVADAWPDETKTAWKGVFPGAGDAAAPEDAVSAYRAYAASRTDVDRQVETKEKTGVFIGAFATNPLTDTEIPIFIADYVLMGYGTGAIMAVPGQDQRDWDFATSFDLDIIRTVQPTEGFDGEAFTGEGPAINSAFLDGLDVAAAKKRIINWLVENGAGERAVNYKLRDWLFSRQRYWGEPFPIVFDEQGLPLAMPESSLPVELPEMEDFAPRVLDDEEAAEKAPVPEPPLGRATEWRAVTLDLGDGPKEYRRELNTMPQWAGSCWYYLRYLDPDNDDAACASEVERYWMAPTDENAAGGVDLYVGGAEHAVLHLLYARFWHKVLFDLGHVSTAEPFGRLFNQGYIQAYAYTDERGVYVDAEEVVEDAPGSGVYKHNGEVVGREYGKMGKSLKNAVAPDDICRDFGADTLRLYEMYLGPLDASKPWNTRDIVGSFRFLQRFWRNFVDEETGSLRVIDAEPDEETRKLLHQTIADVRHGMETLAFNSAIARLIELNNYLTKTSESAGGVPRPVAEAFVLMLAPLAPHVAEELWERLGNTDSLAYAPFPTFDESLLVEDTIEMPVQIKGKVRSKIVVAADADQKSVEETALADEKVQRFLEGQTVRKVIVVPGKLVNIVAG